MAARHIRCQEQGGAPGEEWLCLLHFTDSLPIPSSPVLGKQQLSWMLGKKQVVLCRPEPTDIIYCSILQAEGMVRDPASVSARVSGLTVGWDRETRMAALMERASCSYVQGRVLPRWWDTSPSRGQSSLALYRPCP